MAATLIRFHNRTLVIADSVMQQTIELATRAASSRASVLLCGESGTGKELIARFIHERSRRSQGPFISVNCAAIPDGLMEAELFGYERGAFTGAVQQRIGKFERANGGTLLLDEISEMTVALQAKLLRVLQEGEVDRLGARDAVRIDVRTIATTNRDMEELLDGNRLREDLFYRLNVFRIDCQPLRGRPEAILSLASEFLIQAGTAQGSRPPTLSAAAREKLIGHTWPGNVRELQNSVERAILLCDGRQIEPAQLELISRDSVPEQKTDSLSELEQGHILRVLQHVDGNRTEAAKRLGISVRTLRNKLNEYSR